MRIAVRYPPPLRRWHRVLAAKLEACGHSVAFVPVPLAFSARRDYRMLRTAERLIFGASCDLYAVEAGPAASPAGPFDLALVLAGGLSGAPAAVQPVFDGTAGERALLAALLRGAAPLIAVRGRTARGTSVLAAGLPALQDPQVLARALDDVLPRLVTLLLQAVGRLADAEPPQLPNLDAVASPGRRRPFLRTVRTRLARRLRPGTGVHGCRWQIAVRLVEGQGLAQTQAWSAARHRTLPLDGRSFHADPFPFEHEGRRHLFFEDLPHATQRGSIARVELDDTGTASPPITVLEAPFHLSYPFVLRHGAAVYMLPEAGATGRLVLYRAEPFPDRWVPDKVLLECGVADATPVFHAGRWWMFAASLDGGGSSWDQLALFHASDLLGPWVPHRGNPVLIDAGAARPAGAMWHENGVLMRVAQDCRNGYGRGLAICRVNRLDVDGYAQTVVARLGPPDGFFGVHTLNRSGAIEVIDLEATAD